MTSAYKFSAPVSSPASGLHLASFPGQVLTGKYVGGLRSEKGKLKGLRLQADRQEWAVKLPKYLRPMLVRELVPETWVQVWAYPDGDRWHAVNVMPLLSPPAADAIAPIPPAFTEAVPPATPVAAPVATPAPPKPVRLQVCQKGKCCKQGSRELLRALQEQAAQDPALGHVVVEPTGCLKACKKGPNVRIAGQGKLLSHLSPDEAPALLDRCRG
jgi:hypothetical protein